MPARALRWAVVPLALLAPAAALFGQEDKAAKGAHLGSVVPLNRRTFRGNVLAGKRVEHWIVLFCVDWHSSCEELEGEYLSLADRYMDDLNRNSLFNDVVKFASVNCAVDKALCNEQNVDQYPTVAHYQLGKQGKLWRNRGKFSKWLGKELMCTEGSTAKEASPSPPVLSEEESVLAMRVTASAVTLVALFIWFLSRGNDIWPCSA